jgi:hypothetical protein
MSRPLAVDGSGDVPSPSLGDGVVNCYGPICLERRLVVVQFSQVGLDGRSFIGELASPFRSAMLGVDLLSAGSHLLLLLIGLLFPRREPGV